MRWFFICAAAVALLYFADPSPASRLSYDTATEVGANECLAHIFEIPGEHIDARLRLYRQSSLRFVGHCTLSNWRGDKVRTDFRISRYHESGRWRVFLHIKALTT